MNHIAIKNNQKVDLADIPTIGLGTLRAQLTATNLRPISFFGAKETDDIRLFALLADDEKGEILISSALINPDIKEYDSITQENHQYHMFEREFFEQFNIKPLNHPWLKPVRKNLDSYEFFKMDGYETHDVAVGPIHAGVIEPGHFRFSCHGEKVYNLEIMLGYQHRGIESLMVQNPTNQLAESITGDSVVAHNSAYSEVIEALSGIKISKKAKLIRRIALEMERAAIHIGDMGAILGDIAYLMGKEVYGVTRTLVINSMLEISGSRFARSLITVGGVNFDIKPEMIKKLNNTLNYVQTTVEKMTKAALGSSTVLSRLEKTGVVSSETANELNMVGLMGRSAGVKLDSRFDFKDEIYSNLSKRPFKATGDAYSRFKIRYIETLDSIDFIRKMLKELETCVDNELIMPNKELIPNSLAVSIIEGWRGETIHVGLTNDEGKLFRYKIKDASFNNWWGLSMALRNNAISDFPLCNKGFDLSYAGFDL